MGGLLICFSYCGLFHSFIWHSVDRVLAALNAMNKAAAVQQFEWAAPNTKRDRSREKHFGKWEFCSYDFYGLVCTRRKWWGALKIQGVTLNSTQFLPNARCFCNLAWFIYFLPEGEAECSKINPESLLFSDRHQHLMLRCIRKTHLKRFDIFSLTF